MMVVLAGAGGVGAQEDAAQVVPEPFPWGPDTGVFHVFASKEAGSDNQCGAALEEAFGTGQDQQLYASNNPFDPCRDDGAQVFVGINAPTSATFVIHVFPALEKDVSLRAGEPMTGRLTFHIDRVNNLVDAGFGQFRPKMTLWSGDVILGTWDEAPEIDPSGPHFAAPSSPAAALSPVVFEFDLGAAPDVVPAGVLRLEVVFSNQVNTTDPAASELRFAASRVRIAVDEVDRGMLSLPVSVQAAPVVPVSDGDPDGNVSAPDPEGNVSTTDGNVSEPASPADDENGAPGHQGAGGGSNGTDGDDASAPGESGFVPGLGVAAVLSAVMAVMLVVARGRPPRRWRSGSIERLR